MPIDCRSWVFEIADKNRLHVLIEVMKKTIRTSTVPMSLDTFCRGQLKMLSENFEVVAVSSLGVDLKTIEEREGVRTLPVAMERHNSFFREVWSLLKMFK
jgi:hypothetical protein